MNFVKQLFLLDVLLLLTVALPGQEAVKPSITRITAIPSEPLHVGDCSTNRSGYIYPEKGKSKVTDVQIGKFVSSNLQSGYVLTIYQQADGLVFADMECPAINPKDH
jgi:hypothetical protein